MVKQSKNKIPDSSLLYLGNDVGPIILDGCTNLKNLPKTTFCLLNIPFKKLFNQGMIQGEDGQKMSKSKNNIIDIFLDDKSLKKQIMKIIFMLE